MIAATDTIDLGKVLLDLFLVLVVAKLAAELSERIRVPAVIGEIVAGILLGPSVLGWVETNDVIFALAELGVILLLLQVGLETDPAELGRVGRAALAVAVIGVVAPFAGGAIAGVAMGEATKTAIFVGAALTATSVGITARVFGDLRALATTEARIVLGAAVADDVLGLVILTVVSRVVVEGTIGAGTVATTVMLAVGFLALTALVGLRLVPPLFDTLDRVASSSATLVVAAVGLTLGFAVLADAAQLAPIIGAFMAGLALGRTRQHERIERSVLSLGNVFVPVFFVYIGLEVDVAELARPAVIGTALVLSVIAVIGKLVSAVGTVGTTTDKILVGIGMIPRGEVGLIFATIGLRNGVLEGDLYGAVLLVVLLTTLMTPPLLRLRLARSERPTEVAAAEVIEPLGGWLIDVDDELGVDPATPPGAAVRVALRAAERLGGGRPSRQLIEWFGEHRTAAVVWTPTDTELLLRLLRRDDPMAWRFLALTGVLDRSLPELADELHRRRNDPAELDPLRALRFPTVDRLLELAVDPHRPPGIDLASAGEDEMLLAALVDDVSGDPVARARLAQRLWPGDAGAEVAAIVEGAGLLSAGARDPDSFDPTQVVQLAAHLGSPLRARRGHALAAVRLGPDAPGWQREALDELHDLVQEVFAHPELIGGEARGLADARRVLAGERCDDPDVAERLRLAPDEYLLAHEPDSLVRQARLVEPAPGPRGLRVAVTPQGSPDGWIVDVAARDRPGLLARMSGGISDAGFPIERAEAVTWPDGGVLETFVVRSPIRPSPSELARALERTLHGGLPRGEPLELGAVAIDNAALPWHTQVTVQATDRIGLLRDLATAFSRSGVLVHSARVIAEDGQATLRFAVTERHGRKLDDRHQSKVRERLAATAGAR